MMKIEDGKLIMFQSLKREGCHLARHVLQQQLRPSEVSIPQAGRLPFSRNLFVDAYIDSYEFQSLKREGCHLAAVIRHTATVPYLRFNPSSGKTAI